MLNNRVTVIWMLLKANNKTNILIKVKEAISLILIFSILISFSIWFNYVYHSYTFPYSETNFDFMVKEFTESQIDQIAHESFVDLIFPVRVITGEIRSFNDSIHCALYAVQSFENRKISIFADKFLTMKDEALLLNEALNPIILDFESAEILKVKVGDVVQIPFGSEGEEVHFKVAAIHETMKGRSTALILWSGSQKEIFYESFHQDPLYSFMYVKVNDFANAKEYFINEYIPLQSVEEGYFGIEEMDRIIEYNKSMLIERVKVLKEIQYELRFTPPIVIIASILGFLTYLLVLYRESNKKIIICEKDFAILSALGMPRIYFPVYLVLEVLLLHIPMLIISLFAVKYVIYGMMNNAYLPWYFYYWYCLFAIVLQMLAVTINGFVYYFRVKKVYLASLLSNE